MTPPLDEALLVPLYAAGKAVGTIWIVAHDQSRRFDAEDLRVMTNLASFGGAAYHALLSLRATARAHEDSQLAASALGQSEEHYRALFASIPVAAFVCDSSGVIQTYNRRAVELWGREPQRGAERHCGSVKLYQMDGTLLPHARSPMVEVLRTGIPANDVEVFIERPDGSRIAVNASFAALKDPRGDTIGAITCFDDISARKRAEDALHESAERLRTLVGSSPLATVVIDPDATVRLWNAAAEALFGWTEAEVLGRPVPFIPDSRLPESLACQTAVMRGDIFAIDTQRLRRGGSLVEVSLTAAPLRDARDAITQILVLFEDVTERKRAEALQAGQKRVLELMAQAAPLAEVLGALMGMIEQQSNAGLLGSILLLDDDGVHLRHGAGPSLPHAYNQRVHGLTIGPDVGSCGTAAFLKRPVHVSDIATDPLWANFRELAGSHGLKACWSTPIFSPRGGVLGTFAMYYREARRPPEQDLKLVELATRTAAIVIEHQRIQESRRASEMRFRTIVNQASTGVVESDAAGRMTLVNQRWCEMLGYTEAELLRMTIADVTHPESLAPTLQMVQLLAEGGPDFVIEKRYRRNDGSTLWATSSVNAVRGPAGEYQGLVAVVLDVSERKQAEVERAALHGQLERELADAQHLQEISTELIQEGNADVLYDHILNAATAVMHSDMASMQILSADRSELRLLAWKGFDPDSAALWERVGVDSGSSCGAALRTELRTVVPDIETGGSIVGAPDLEAHRRSGIRAAQSTPLVSRFGRLLGVISNYWREPHRPAQRDLRLLDVLARQAADLIERRRTEALVSGQKRVLEMVATGAALSDVLATLIRVIEEQSDGLLGSILVRQQGGSTFCMGVGPGLPQAYTEALQRMPITPLYASPCGMAAHRGEATSVADVAVDERWSKEWRTHALGCGLRGCYSTPIHASDGTVLGSFGMYSRDLRHSSPDPQLLETATHLAGIAIERKQAEDTLRRRTSQFETLLAEAPLGVYLIDDQFRIREVNPTALAAFGSIPHLIGRDFGEVIHLIWPRAYADEVVDVFRHTLETGEPHVAPERVEQRLDRGVNEYYEWQISRIPLPAGRYGVVCYFRDISAQVFARAAIAESQERLRQAAKMEAIGRLAGGLAHDFNNQLHALLGFAAYAARDPGIGTRAQLDILEVQKAAERMADLTRQLLAFSRQQVLKPEILDVDEAVADGQELLRRLIGSQIEFRIERDAGAKWVRVDRTQLQQVLMNLCINARDAMPEGGRLEVHTAIHAVASAESVPNGDRLIPRGDYVELVVTDTGSGIPAEHLPHIFEPFFTTKEIGRGTGLGLATVDGIVAQSQGYIWADTAPGHGTRFTVLLPLSPGPAGVPMPEVTAALPAARRSRILVVEDEEIVRSLVARALRDEGYDVVEAGNGREALARLDEHGDTITLVLSDVMMPVLSGTELGERLAAERSNLPVVWMSGYPRDTAFVGGQDSAQQPFLQKPVAPEVLIGTIRSVLMRPPTLSVAH